MTRMRSGEPWLYDNVTGDLAGVKDPDGSEFYWQRIPNAGAFHDTTTQSAAAINTGYALTLNATDLARGLTVVDGSKLTVARGGIYSIAFSTQFDRANGGTDAVSIWLRKNGVDFPDSCTDVTISGNANAAKAVAAWNFFVEAAAGDYFELIWSTPNTDVKILYQAARENPSRPAIPSLIVTVNEVAAPPVN